MTITTTTPTLAEPTEDAARLVAPKRLATAVAATTAALGAVAGATIATGAPTTVVAAAAGVLAFGGGAVAMAVRQPVKAEQ